VIHDGQRLPLGLEAGNHLARVHAGLDNLERDLAMHWLRLLGHVDRAHAAFADLLQKFVRADDRAGLLGWLDIGCRRQGVDFKKRIGVVVRPKKSVQAISQIDIAMAMLVQIGDACRALSR
jgi:hypothetical protein